MINSNTTKVYLFSHKFLNRVWNCKNIYAQSQDDTLKSSKVRRLQGIQFKHISIAFFTICFLHMIEGPRYEDTHTFDLMMWVKRYQDALLDKLTKLHIEK